MSLKIMEFFKSFLTFGATQEAVSNTIQEAVSSTIQEVAPTTGSDNASNDSSNNQSDVQSTNPSNGTEPNREIDEKNSSQFFATYDMFSREAEIALKDIMSGVYNKVAKIDKSELGITDNQDDVDEYVQDHVEGLIEMFEKVADRFCGEPLSNSERILFTMIRIMRAGQHLTPEERHRKTNEIMNQILEEEKKENEDFDAMIRSANKRLNRARKNNIHLFGNNVGHVDKDENDPYIKKFREEMAVHANNEKEFENKLREAYKDMRNNISGEITEKMADELEEQLLEFAKIINENSEHKLIKYTLVRCVGNIIDEFDDNFCDKNDKNAGEFDYTDDDLE